MINKKLLLLCIGIVVNFHSYSQWTDITSSIGGGLTSTTNMAKPYVFDLNNDNYPDFLVPVLTTVASPYTKYWRLYKNNGNSTFTDVTTSYGLPTNLTSTLGFIDYNGDGFKDLYFYTATGLQILKNNNGTSFTDVSTQLGIASAFFISGEITSSLKVFDYDVDGDEDLLYTRTVSGVNTLTAIVNNGISFSTKVNIINSIPGATTGGINFSFFDMDNDGDFDIVFDAFSGTSQYSNGITTLYRKDATGYINTTSSSGLVNGLPGEISTIDINQDGNLDIVKGGADCCSSPLYRVFIGNGTGVFTEQTSTFSISNGAYKYSGTLTDFDNDTDFDFSWSSYTSTGAAPFRLYVNNGSNVFAENATTYGLNLGVTSGGVPIDDYGNGVWMDIDKDGDLDIILNRQGEGSTSTTGNVWVKRNPIQGNYINIKLNGCGVNKSGIGAKIKLVVGTNTKWLYYEKSPDGNITNGTDTFHFGLGTATLINSITVYWPNNTTTVLNNVTGNQFLTIGGGAGDSSAPTGSASQTLCSGSTVANLSATGTSIQWYSTSTGGTALASTTALVNGTTYYASQTVSGCESTTRLAVTVTLNNPTVSASLTTVCSGQSTTISVDNSNSNAARFFNLRGPSQPNQIVSINQWHNIVVTKQNLDGKVFIDGNLVISGQWANNSYNWTSLHLGANFYTGWDSFFKGWIDEVRISNIVRTDNEIINNYNLNTPYINDINTIGLWHFDESNGTNFINQSNGINGSLYNGPTFQSGKFGNSLYFDGIDDRGDCNFNMPENNFTLELWVKIDGDIISGPSGRVVFIEPHGVYNSEMGFFPENNNSTFMWSTGATTASISVTPTSTTQYWVDVTTNGVTCRKESTITVNSTTPTPTTQPMALAFSSVTGTSLSGSFTVPSPAPTGFMVVRSTSATAPIAPTNGTALAVGSTALGAGTSVVANTATGSFTDAGLSANTQYYYYIYAYNSGCVGTSPVYLTTTPLTGNVVTTPTSSLTQVVEITANGPVIFCTGGTVQLTGSVSPSGIYQYQWLKDNVNISGQNAISYSPTSSGVFALKVTALNGSVFISNLITVTINPLPPSPVVTYNSPTIICGGSPIILSDNLSTNVSYQWFFNNDPINNATNNSYAANQPGTYKLVVSHLTTGCSSTSQNVIVGEMPKIVPETIVTCGNGATISLTNPNFSFSSSQVSCNVDMSTASIVNTNVGSDGGGSQSKIICFGGNVTIDGSGSNVFVVEYGGTLNGFGGGGSNTAYVKSGGIYNYNSGGGGGNVVYYEPGAIINAGGTQTVQCSSIGVIYPTNTTALCNNLTYLWSNGATTPTITVNPSVQTTYTVTVSKGSLSCTDQVVVIPGGANPSPPTITASGPTALCQGESVVLTSSYTSGNVWSNGATTQSITVTQSGSYTVSYGSCLVTSLPKVVTITSPPNNLTVLSSGPTSFCEGESVTLSLNSLSAVRYLKFESYYSEDDGQVNVHEIQAFSNGVNVALNKPGVANSYGGGGGSDWASKGSKAVDGDSGSRWSSNRHDPGPDLNAPHYIVIDLQNQFNLESILLDIEFFKQTFSFKVSQDNVNWIEVGNGNSVSGSFTFTPPLTNYSGYLWSNGATTPSITVSNSGAYSVTAFIGTTCSVTSNSVIVTVNTNTYYADADGDGFGAGPPVLLCSPTPPTGYATNNSDCNDGLATLTTSCVVTLPLKVLIQGYYKGSGQMTPVRKNAGISNSNNEVDEVTVALYSPSNLNQAIATSTVVLTINGAATVQFDTTLLTESHYYLAIQHKNTIKTWSATPVAITNGTTYDFTTAASQAYGNNQIEVAPGIYAIYSGDMNQDGSINEADLPMFTTANTTAAHGYIVSDLNGDGSVDLLDYPIYKNNAAASVNEVRPLSLPVLPTLITTEVSNITKTVLYTGGVIAATGGVNPNNSIGAISLAGAAANTANCSTINAANPLLTLTLGHELPPGTVITISIAKNTAAGSVRISDGINSQTFNTGTNNALQYITFTMGRLTDIITITRVNGNVYVDGIRYSITYSEASTGGTITSNGGADITARGVVWSTTPIPTTALATKTTNGTGTGTFTSTLTGLAPATTYYVRAYATNGAGTAYGNEVSFTTTN
ncbi:FG-GAP-like repeat-containing protein [Flavobacterium sp.]|jgi:hypothetical protein|uniref:FG-GAP-like repeat-containing protein n=1 Tax=Flavobacterium sp. TaxID=239 RepID=UPI0037842FEA